MTKKVKNTIATSMSIDDTKLLFSLQDAIDRCKKNNFGPIVCISRKDALAIVSQLERFADLEKSAVIQVQNLPDEWVDVKLDDDNSFEMSDHLGAERFRLK